MVVCTGPVPAVGVGPMLAGIGPMSAVGVGSGWQRLLAGRWPNATGAKLRWPNVRILREAHAAFCMGPTLPQCLLAIWNILLQLP